MHERYRTGADTSQVAEAEVFESLKLAQRKKHNTCLRRTITDITCSRFIQVYDYLLLWSNEGLKVTAKGTLPLVLSGLFTSSQMLILYTSPLRSPQSLPIGPRIRIRSDSMVARTVAMNIMNLAEVKAGERGRSGRVGKTPGVVCVQIRRGPSRVRGLWLQCDMSKYYPEI